MVTALTPACRHFSFQGHLQPPQQVAGSMSPPLEYQQGLWPTERGECDICSFGASTSRSFVRLCPIPCEQVQANLPDDERLVAQSPRYHPSSQTVNQQKQSFPAQAGGRQSLPSQLSPN